MSTVFGSNEDRFNKQGDSTFFDKTSGKHDRIFHAGSSAMSEEEHMFNAGRVSSFGNQHIFGNSNAYECNGKRYTRVGNTLFGSDGKRWMGGDNMTDGDIRDIISHDF